MSKKIQDIMLQSVYKRFIILGSVILLGLFGGYWVANSTPSILEELSPKVLLLTGVGLGLVMGYGVGLARGIMRVIKVTEKEEVYLPAGKLKYTK